MGGALSRRPTKRKEKEMITIMPSEKVVNMLNKAATAIADTIDDYNTKCNGTTYDSVEKEEIIDRILGRAFQEKYSPVLTDLVIAYINKMENRDKWNEKLLSLFLKWAYNADKKTMLQVWNNVAE